MTALTDALWQRYRADGDPDARSQLLDRYLGLVHHAAHEMAARVGHAVELDDLVSAGTLGLIQALEAFELSRGLAFSTYAVQRIRGAILDELRSRDWRPRSVRAKGRKLAATITALETELGRAPEPREIAAAMGIPLDAYWKLREDIDGGLLLSLGAANRQQGEEAPPLEDTIPDARIEEPAAHLGKEEQVQQVRAAIQELPPRERTVLALYYYEELNLKQIAEVLHVTESRVSQIRTQALKRLRGNVALLEERI